MQKNIAVSTVIETPQTEIVLLNKNPTSQSKLVASWRLNEQKQLYCQWIKQTTNSNK